MKQFIIGITGTIGAGKGTIVNYLIEKWGFKHLSVRQYLIDQIEKEGLPVNRDTMVMIANRIRADHTPSFIVDELYKIAAASGENCVIESIRTVGEVDSLSRNENFHLFAVTADPHKRYERILIRNSETDHIDYETFISNEQREMTSEDPNKQNLAKCIAAAEVLFMNDGTIEELEKLVEDKWLIISRQA